MEQLTKFARTYETRIPSSMTISSARMRQNQPEDLHLPKIEKNGISTHKTNIFKTLGDLTIMHLFRNNNNKVDFELRPITPKIRQSTEKLYLPKKPNDYERIENIVNRQERLQSSKNNTPRRQLSIPSIKPKANIKKSLTLSSNREKPFKLNVNIPNAFDESDEYEEVNYLNAENLSSLNQVDNTKEQFCNRMLKWLNNIEKNVDLVNSCLFEEYEFNDAFDNLSEFSSSDEQIIETGRIVDKTYCFVHND